MRKIYFLIIIVLVALACLMIYDSSRNNLTSDNYNLPDDYKIIENNSGNLTYSNGKNQIILFKLNENFSIDSYLEHFSDKYNITVEDFSLNSKIKKSVTISENGTIVKYWFKKNNEYYQIQVSENSAELDKIVYEMILSI